MIERLIKLTRVGKYKHSNEGFMLCTTKKPTVESRINRKYRCKETVFNIEPGEDSDSKSEEMDWGFFLCVSLMSMVLIFYFEDQSLF